MILRLRDRKLLPLSEARTQIEASLAGDQTIEELRGKTQGITAEFNLKYLEAPTQPELFPPSMINQTSRRHSVFSTSGLGQP